MPGGFFFDDEQSILQPEGVRLQHLDGASLREALASGSAGPTGRPVAQLSFALNHYFSGFDPLPYKAVNLAIHAINGLLVFGLALRLVVGTAQRHGSKTPRLAAGLLALAWLLHPLQLTAVLHVVQRMTSLSALFLLSGLLLHIAGRERGDRRGWILLMLAWGAMWPLAFLSKESGVLFPAFALAWELIVRRQRQGGADGFMRLFAALAGLTFIAGIAYALSSAGGWLWAGYALRDFSLVERLMSEGRVLWFYLGLMLFPRLEALGLYHDDIAISRSLFEPWTTLPAWAGLAALAWLAWRLRERRPLIALGIAWFFVGHLIESTVLPLELAHEHRNYLPLLGFLLAVAGGLGAAMSAGGPSRTLAIALAASALVYWPFVTALRAHQFGETVRRTQIEAQHHRASPRAQYEAGRALAQGANSVSPASLAHGLARAHFALSGDLDSRFKPGLLGQIYLDCRGGGTADPLVLEELAKRLREHPFAPGDEAVLHGLKELAIVGKGCPSRPEVERLFTAAQSNPLVAPTQRAGFHAWLADYLTLGAHDLAAAEKEIGRALSLAPRNARHRLKQAQLAFLQGRDEEAGRILAGLKGAALGRAERETLARIESCLESKEARAKCGPRQPTAGMGARGG